MEARGNIENVMIVQHLGFFSTYPTIAQCSRNRGGEDQRLVRDSRSSLVSTKQIDTKKSKIDIKSYANKVYRKKKT